MLNWIYIFLRVFPIKQDRMFLLLRRFNFIILSKAINMYYWHIQDVKYTVRM